MTDQNTTLHDFTTDNNDGEPLTESPTNSQKNGQTNATTESETQESAQASPSPGGIPPNDGNSTIDDDEDDPVCPHYTEDLQKCKERVGSDLVKELNIHEVKCGHAIHYLCEDVDVKLARSTAGNYSACLRQFVEFLHARGMTVCDAELRDVKSYLRSLAKRNLKEKTIKSHRSGITNLYKHIELYREAETNVRWSTIQEAINVGEYNTPEAREREPLEKEEVKKLYDALDSFRNRLMVQVGVELGPRSIDIRSITISDVDLEEQYIELSNTKSNRTYELPISNQLCLLLRRWIEHERAAHPGAEDSNYLFPSKHGGKLSTDRLCQIVKNAAERAGIQEEKKSETPFSEKQKEVLGTEKDYPHYKKVTPHALRHTFNHLLDEAGIPRQARSAALDHEGEEVTKKFYDHQETDYQELLRGLFSDKDSLLDE